MAKKDRAVQRRVDNFTLKGWGRHQALCQWSTREHLNTKALSMLAFPGHEAKGKLVAGDLPGASNIRPPSVAKQPPPGPALQDGVPLTPLDLQ